MSVAPPSPTNRGAYPLAAPFEKLFFSFLLHPLKIPKWKEGKEARGKTISIAVLLALKADSTELIWFPRVLGTTQSGSDLTGWPAGGLC